MDIVERLRFGSPNYFLCGDAAIEIERLREQAHYHYENGLKKDVEIERLRELLNADNQTLRLHFGELTLNEMRIIKSAFQWVLIRAELKENK